MTPPRPSSLGEALAATRARLGAAGIDSAALDARLLVAHAADVTPELLVGWPETALAPDAASRLDALVARRAAREPVARLIGVREFWSLRFAVSGATLVPRPETETLVEAALAAMPAPARILDLGTGTGCVLLALLSERPAATGLGIDLAPDAVALARVNAERLGLAARATFRRGDWLDGVEGAFDLIVANPPYVASGELAGLMEDVRDHEPALALDGGPDGLAAYRAIAAGLARVLAPDGAALFEVGARQAAAVEDVLAAAGLVPAGRRRDLAGIERVVEARSRP